MVTIPGNKHTWYLILDCGSSFRCSPTSALVNNTHAQRRSFQETSTWYLFLDRGSRFCSSPMSDFGKNHMNIQTNKRIQNILSILFCYSLEIMSHNREYYLKELSKKLPPGCSKLENFGFGKQVIQSLR